MEDTECVLFLVSYWNWTFCSSRKWKCTVSIQSNCSSDTTILLTTKRATSSTILWSICCRILFSMWNTSRKYYSKILFIMWSPILYVIHSLKKRLVNLVPNMYIYIWLRSFMFTMLILHYHVFENTLNSLFLAIQKKKIQLLLVFINTFDKVYYGRHVSDPYVRVRIYPTEKRGQELNDQRCS